MSKERAVNLSIENGIFVVECLKAIRISLQKDRGNIYVDNIDNEKLAFTGNNYAVEYYLNVNPEYRFIEKFKQPQSAKYINEMFEVVIAENEGCLITLPDSKDEIFVYNESGLLCFRGVSEIIDKFKTTAFVV